MFLKLFSFVFLLFSLISLSFSINFDEVDYDLPSNITEIIRHYGYPCEDHYALTSDGYYLSMQRLPQTSSPKAVVFFQHGLTDNANGISLNPPKEGLPFLLYNAGYEVWLGNNRGNGYSMRNTQYSTSDSAFWQFTWDQMAAIDLPTQIEYALSVSGFSTLSYIGHSEGTTQAFSGFSINHDLASKVNIFIALAPVAYVGNQRSILLEALAKLDTAQILELLGDNEFDLSSAVQTLIPDFCKILPSACDDVLEVLMGPSTNTNVTRLPYYLHYEPNPTSVLNMAHWSQMVNTDTFQMFDYGSQGNLQHYNQTTPPVYSLGNLPTSLPIALFTGGNDYLADPTDVERLISELPVSPVKINNQPSYSHTDFLWAEDAYDTIYPLIISLVQQYS